MADNVAITAGSGTTVAADEVVDGTLGTVKVQYVKVMDGVLDSTTKMTIKAASTAPVATDPAVVVAISPNSVNSNGQATMANSAPVVLASNQSALAVTGTFWQATQPVSGTVSITDISGEKYKTVAASSTATVLGATGATGDYVSGLLVVPATTSPGNVLLLDNATSITVFTGGATSVSNLVPFFIPLGMKSVSGAWKVTTGANVSVIGIGNFT